MTRAKVAVLRKTGDKKGVPYPLAWGRLTRLELQPIKPPEAHDNNEDKGKNPFRPASEGPNP